MTFTIFQSIILYLLPVIALGINIYFKNHIVRTVVFVYYTALICLRWQVGIDFQTYTEWIKNYDCICRHRLFLWNGPYLSFGLLPI